MYGGSAEFTIIHSSELKSKTSQMTTSVHVIECSHWNLQWKCILSQGQTTQWIMTAWECSEQQHLTTVLIETRLTKDILLDEIGEI